MTTIKIGITFRHSTRPAEDVVRTMKGLQEQTQQIEWDDGEPENTHQISREKFEPEFEFLLKFDNVNVQRHKLCLFSLNTLI